MTRRSQGLSRTFLPLLALCLCYASGYSNDSSTAAMPAAVAAPAIPNNAPPTIALASVEEAQVGATFDYQPVAQDPELDTLRFTAINLPTWASFDSNNGRISGTPGPDDAGLYESISITVADAKHLVVTAPFSIVVSPAVNPGATVDPEISVDPAPELGTGVASLQWEMPPSKVSGEPLDDLAGYRILYGHSTSDLDHSVMILDPAITSYQFTTLTSGTWYFAVVAVSSNGLEGPPTTYASKSI